MRESRRCILCGSSWSKGDTPPCQHSTEEWDEYRRQCDIERLGLNRNRHERRKAEKAELKLLRAEVKRLKAGGAA